MTRMKIDTSATVSCCEPLEGRPFLTAAHGVVYTPHAVVAGKSLGQWGAEWVKWALGTPTDVNPLLDTTGKNAKVNQPKDVFFLGGTLGSGSVSRKTTVPANKPIFFPVLNDFWVNVDKAVPGVVDQPDPPFKGNESAIRANFDDVAKGYSKLFATVDGNPIFSLQSHREEDPRGGFQVKWPADNVTGLPANVLGRSATQGIYVMVKPLSPGKHTIHFGGTSAAYNPDVKLDITYTITVAGSSPTPKAVAHAAATPFASGASIASSVLGSGADNSDD